MVRNPPGPGRDWVDGEGATVNSMRGITTSQGAPAAIRLWHFGTGESEEPRTGGGREQNPGMPARQDQAGEASEFSRYAQVSGSNLVPREAGDVNFIRASAVCGDEAGQRDGLGEEAKDGVYP